MKRTIPLLITALGGIVLIVAFFIPAFESWGEEVSIWFDILAAIAFILGGGNLFKVHLKTISDRKKGWGYSAITLLAFLAMLIVGLFKLGSRPSPSTEFYGESLVAFPLEWMPTFESPGALRPTAHPVIPASLRRQLHLGNGTLRIQGWVSGTEAEALDGLDDELAWRCACEKLSERAQPPRALRGKVRHLADHGKLAFRGVMSSEEQQALTALFPGNSRAKAAIDQLAAASRVVHMLNAISPPSFVVPESLASAVRLTESGLECTGPLSLAMVRTLSREACHYPLSRWLPETERRKLLQQLEAEGAPLSPAQRTAFDNLFAGIPKVDVLLLQLESVGTASNTKSSCELLAEKVAGTQNLEREVPPAEPPTPMTEDQKRALRRFVENPTMSVEEWGAALVVAKLSQPRMEAVEEWLSKLPTLGARKKELCIELLKAGNLARRQQDWLLADARTEFAWRKAVGQLAERSHTVLYPWSGDYSEGGTPFDWMYTWVLQPLMTTTFALLAFYVASAAFRAFRAKNLEAILLLGTALIILFRATLFGSMVGIPLTDGSWFGMDRVYAFVMNVFNTAGNRAIMIGISLGIASTSLKVLLGIDRSYLGSDD